MNSQAPSSPIGIIAGNGHLPLELAEALTAQDRTVYIIGIEGEAEAGIADYPHDRIEWGQIGRLFKHLKENRVETVTFAGGVLRRPDIDIRKMDWGALVTVPQILGSLFGGDNTIVSGVVVVFEKRGFSVAGIRDIAPQLLVRDGANTQQKPNAKDLERIAQGARLVRTLGPFDVGQGCVLIGRRAVAVEGIEGTDDMLARVATLREQGRLPKKRGGVLVKCSKPGQDDRVDLPTIGPRTIEGLYQAGLSGIGVESNKTILLDRERTLSRARELSIFVYGIGALLEDAG